MIAEEEIKLKVLGENEARRVLNLVVPKMQKFLDKCKGIKILKVNGCFTKEISQGINDILKPLREQIKITPFKQGHYAEISSLYLSATTYDLSLKLTISFNGGEYEDKTYYCIYYDKPFYLCRVENSRIKDFYENKELPFKMINAEEQIKQIKKCSDILKQFNEEKEKINPYELRNYVR